MDLQSTFDSLASVIRSVPRSELLVAAVVAMLAGWIGAALVRRRVKFGRALNLLSSLALGAILLTVVLQVSRFDPRMSVAVPQLGLPEQVVEGGETRIPLSPDGHYWVRARINGTPGNFLIDTGATISAISPALAERAGLEPRRGGIPVNINTANGAVIAKIASARTIAFGNIEAQGIDVVIAPGLGETNIIGMNFLSRLDGWRVEKGTMVLTPATNQTES
ncbi:retropepsin-like aspartic protease family protein [Qipengyuania sediminis]|uniref:retropepsin-like aspartic protease family protein n=1 Tax=Qipengyuania sediminis TaxID=1532023 RepID=UPI00105A6FA6|nr:TIGR02281 family clan AA aspartic protease [Qipengyuania sediminis]